MEGIKPASQSHLQPQSPLINTSNISLSLKRKKYLLYLMDPSENDLQLLSRKPNIPSKEEMFRLHTMPRIFEKNPGGLSKDKMSNGLNGLFQDICTELIHNRNDDDVYIRVYNSEIESPCHHQLWHWNEFTFVGMEVSFMKPGEKDLVHLPDVQVQSPCGMVHCPCRQATLCAFTRLCPYSELRPAFEFKEYFGRQYYCIRIMVSLIFFKNEELPKHKQLQKLYLASRERLGQKMLTQNLHSDFTLRIGEETFPCHRSVLAGQSDVFAAMFESGMTEATTDELVLEDMSSECVEAFLKYLYHGDIQDAVSSPDLALELLGAGNKYGIEFLERTCKEILMSFRNDSSLFNAGNALHMFAFCGKIEDLFGLRDKAVKIIKQNAEEFTRSKQFAHLLETDFDLALQLMRGLAG